MVRNGKRGAGQKQARITHYIICGMWVVGHTAVPYRDMRAVTHIYLWGISLKYQIASSMLPTRPAARISFSLSCLSRSSDTSPVNIVQNEPIVRPSHLTGAPR